MERQPKANKYFMHGAATQSKQILHAWSGIPKQTNTSCMERQPKANKYFMHGAATQSKQILHAWSGNPKQTNTSCMERLWAQPCQAGRWRRWT
jgi:hypothetical protein